MTIWSLEKIYIASFLLLTWLEVKVQVWKIMMESRQQTGYMWWNHYLRMNFYHFELNKLSIILIKKYMKAVLDIGQFTLHTSLDRLGDVLASLTSKKEDVPYENSLLTKALSDSLGTLKKFHLLLLFNQNNDSSCLFIIFWYMCVCSLIVVSS